VPAAVALDVQDFTWTDRGGPESANLTATGQDVALWHLLATLGKVVHIVNEFGTVVWWGIVDEVTLNFGHCRVGASLEDLANRVRIVYTDYDAAGKLTTYYTDWADNADSQAQFGFVKELAESIGDANADLAANRRTRLLAERAWPVGVPSAGRSGGTHGAELHCSGLMATLTYKYYQNLFGRIENTSSGSETIAIGWQVSGSNIGFEEGAVHHIGAQLSPLAAGDRVAVSGGTNNGLLFTVDAATDETQVTVTSNQIYFRDTDEIYDDNGYLWQLREAEFFQVSGSARNDGYWWLKNIRSASFIEISQENSGKNIITDEKGPTVTLTLGHSVTTETTIASEVPGSAITLTLYGYIIAQKFTANANMTTGTVMFRAAKFGTPADSLAVDICADSAGTPGTVLGTATLAAASMYSALTDYALTMPAVALTNGTSYWLKWRRTGSVSGSSGYQVQVAAGAYETTMAYTGSGWTEFTRDGDAYSVPFRLWDTNDTATLIAAIVAAGGQSLVTGVRAAATGVARCQYTDNDSRALDEVVKLLDAGNSSGQRLVCLVGHDSVLEVAAEPEADWAVTPVLRNDGYVQDALGAAWEPGRLPVGRWLHIGGLPQDVNAAWRVSPVYVERATWDCRQKRMTSYAPRAARRPFTVLERG
jgi:hypothetical protein